MTQISNEQLEELKKSACKNECNIGEVVETLCLWGYEPKRAWAVAQQWYAEHNGNDFQEQALRGRK